MVLHRTKEPRSPHSGPAGSRSRGCLVDHRQRTPRLTAEVDWWGDHHGPGADERPPSHL